MVSQKILRQWLAFNQLYIFNPDDIRQLMTLGHQIDFFSMSEKAIRDAGFSDDVIGKLQQLDEVTVEAELKWVERPNHHIITLQDDSYPALLREINSPPLVIYVWGQLEDLNRPQLAMVGSRNSTPIGEETAKHFANYLAKSGWVITSGLAMGIDAASHRGALGVGQTIAVLGSGLNYIYPAKNQGLAGQIAEHGAVLSEFPLHMPPKRENFPKRNRIISGLSVGVLVVEAALRSGSLITARFAMEQGREVFAIPGSIHHPLARGCHRLIRQGAKLVETAEDVIEELGSLVDFVHLAQISNEKVAEERKNEETFDFFSSDPEYIQLLSSIGYESTAVDTIILRTGFTPQIVSSMLLSLELNGIIKAGPGGYSRLK